jgi:DNA-binding GntR family transcriptional regulator
VREALRELESLRFVESEQFRGARVRAVSPEELAEIYPVRAALEEVAGREAAKRLRGQVRALEVELEEMRAAARDGDIHRQVEHDVRFHRLIVESAGNATLLEVWRSLRIEVRTVITLLAGGVDPAELVEMHVPVLEALRAGDPDEAGRVLRHHVEHFADLFLKANE